MKAALQRVSGAGDSQVTESSNSNVAPLKTRLQQAIENMQEGLVERDTEVLLCSTFRAATDKRSKMHVCNIAGLLVAKGLPWVMHMTFIFA